MSINSFEDLRIYQLARDICKRIWEITRRPEIQQDRGLVFQMLDSSGSMMDNVAEGYGRGSNNEFKSFLAYGKASSCELLSQLRRLDDRSLLSDSEFDEMVNMNISYQKQTTSLIKKIKDRGFKGYRLH